MRYGGSNSLVSLSQISIQQEEKDDQAMKLVLQPLYVIYP